MAQQRSFNPGFSMAGAVDLESLKHKVEADPGQAGGAPAAGGYVIDANEGMFQSLVQNSATYPIVLLFWMPDDDRLFGMARALGDAVNGMGGQLQLARIDIATNPQLAQAFQVPGAPALYALVGGRPMPILSGLPSPEELQQIVDTVLPQIVQLAQQAGVTGTAPYMEGAGAGADGAGADGAAGAGAGAGASGTVQVPPAHQEAYSLAQQGDYAGAAAAYGDVLESDPSDALAARERAKALLLARSADADVRAVRTAAADNPDDLAAQLAVADVDMIGGQLDDAFGRLLDFAAAHRADMDPVRERLLEYFLIPDDGDERVSRARRRLATLMY